MTEALEMSRLKYDPKVARRTKNSITSAVTGAILQKEFNPCGGRRCDRCFTGPKEPGATREELKQTRRMKNPPLGHGPYFHTYRRDPITGKMQRTYIKRENEHLLAAEFGKDYAMIEPIIYEQWTEQKSREEQHDRGGRKRSTHEKPHEFEPQEVEPQDFQLLTFLVIPAEPEQTPRAP